MREHHDVFGTGTTAAAPAESARGSSADADFKRDEKRYEKRAAGGTSSGAQRNSGLSDFERLRFLGKGTSITYCTVHRSAVSLE